ncbi:uncharacterized protein LOC111083551, partial [Limulus polyphemus]|uniref:Uncharacterized protein LOC111083551 n=1 Tax=Limulus polyphemus TaxID=6850 RepID=A0ABM1RWU3_LIMPO
YYLTAHIRGIVRPEDLDRYDDLIYKHKIQALKNKEAVKQIADQSEDPQPLRTTSPLQKDVRSPRGSFLRKTPCHRLTVPDNLLHHKEAPPAENERTPSQDSGVDVANETRFKYTTPKATRTLLGSRFHQTSDKRHKSYPLKSPRLLPRRSFDVHSGAKELTHSTLFRRLTLRRHSSGGEGVNPEERREEEDRRWSIGSDVIGSFRKEKPKHSSNSPTQRDHKSPGSSPCNVVQENCTNWLQVPHVRVRRHRSLPDPHAILPRKHQQLGPPLNPHRSASMRLPGHRATPEPNGRLRIIIKKTRPLLGIAIEGGVNTGQPLPRIISIHASGAAFEAGGLKVGHIILEVNGFKTGKMKHHEVAQLIADSFYSSDTDQLELLVVEKARTELELRRSSFLVLE